MRNKHCISVLFLSFSFLLAEAQLTAPVAKKQPKVFDEHGTKRVDDYYWLSDKKDTAVINHLKAENAYFEASLRHTEAFQQKLYDELVSRIPQRDISLPTRRNGYWYYNRFEEGKQYPYYVRKKGTLSAAEQVLLDIPEMAKNHQIFLLRGTNNSPNGGILAYSVDTSGDRLSTLYFKDLGTDKLYPETISNTSGSTAWFNDNKTIYYVVNDHTVRAYKVMRHLLGTAPSTDTEIYTEKDSTYSVSVSKSKDNKYIFIGSFSTNTSEYRFIDANDPASSVKIVQPRTLNVEYYLRSFEGDVFHILTNKDAKNFKLVTAPVKDPSMKNWKDLIPHNPKAYLESYEILKDYIMAQTKENGLTQIRYLDRKRKQWQQVNFGQDAYVANMYMATDDYATDSIRYNFNSLTTPSSDYLYNLSTQQKQLLKQQKVGDAFNPDLYETKRIWATATDGTKVPVSIVYKKDKFKKDGTMPLYLYSYGSYGSNSDPYFNSAAISLLDRGVSYAIAHIRGGQELGRDWYEQGRILTKKNTFTDFIDVADYMVKEKYTSADRMFANGVSAGGMLMGAITNMRPDLFRGIIAEVPWMDVITDMFNTDLPLTTLEYDEWGDPNKPEHYKYMLSWSPMDNVKPAKYPAIFATGGLNDTQVPYFSPAKWVAKIRENNTGTNPVLFRIEMGAGHGGQSGRFIRQKLTAQKFSFVLDQLGWNEETKTFNTLKGF
ncbi:MAG: S9 family peptidase [Chitinophagaceae bacterium]|nr:S9 family peptidase [Chitinophagaceae bacterium]